jgi:hypothetical protein
MHVNRQNNFALTTFWGVAIAFVGMCYVAGCTHSISKSSDDVKQEVDDMRTIVETIPKDVSRLSLASVEDRSERGREVRTFAVYRPPAARKQPTSKGSDQSDSMIVLDVSKYANDKAARERFKEATLVPETPKSKDVRRDRTIYVYDSDITCQVGRYFITVTATKGFEDLLDPVLQSAIRAIQREKM